MKNISAALLLIAILCSASAVFSRPQETQPKPEPAPAPEMQFITQLVGEWDVQFKMYMQPDQPPATATGTDRVRAIGDHWVVAETTFTLFETPFTGVLSVGYDAEKKRFNATWIDAMSGYLWVYKGALNEARDTLTLETEGPSAQDPTKNARYKEVMKITGKDTRTFSSSLELEDGTWMTILTAKYTRRK